MIFFISHLSGALALLQTLSTPVINAKNEHFTEMASMVKAQRAHEVEMTSQTSTRRHHVASTSVRQFDVTHMK